MQKGTIGAAKIGGSIALLLVAVIFSVYLVFPVLANLDNTVNTIVLQNPANNTYIKGTIILNASLTGTNVSDNATFYYWNNSVYTYIGLNQTIGPTNFTRYFNTTTLKDNVYSFFVNATNLTGAVANATNGNITVDNTAPVLNFPAPANASYISGLANEVFQINITETNLNPAVNATLYYMSSGAPTWNTKTLECYNSTGLANTIGGPFKCNTTANVNYGEGVTVYFLFNTTDLAGNIGTNGTESAKLSAITDRTAPTPTISTTNSTINTIAVGAGINLSVKWTDNYALYNAILWTNETCNGVQPPTCAGQNKTTAYGSPYTLSGAAGWSNFTWANASIPAGTVIAWKVYANDQVQPIRNENVSIQGTFTIDGTAPTPSGNATSLNSPQTYNTSNNYGFQINWNDAVGVSNATFELGRPDGTNYNYTNATTPGVQYLGSTFWINFTQAAFGPGGTYNFTWLANDTSNNWNRNDTISYVIVPAAAPVVTLLLNGTAANSSYNKTDIVNQSAVSSISGLTVTLYNNMSGTLALIGSRASSVNVTNDTTSLTLGTYLVLANVSSNANYTANATGVNYTISLLDHIIPTLIIRNATSQQYLNNTYVKTGTNLTLNISVSDNDRFANSFNASVYINTTFIGNITNTTSDNTVNGTVTIPAGLANGNSFLNVSVSDASGNIAYNTSIMVIVDSVNPVLNFPTPANNSYITGSSAQLFQINVTETNFDSSKNVTLFIYNLSTWYSYSMTCYDAAGTKALSSGPYMCNKTLNLYTGDWPDNANVRYYFNTTDLAGNTGNNGTATAWLNATIDRANPQFIANASSPATYQNYLTSANYSFQINWTNGGGIDKVLFQLGRPSGALNNYTSATTPAVANTSATYYINFSQAAFGPSGIYNITWFANDTSGNANATQTWNYQIYNSTNVLNLYLINSTATYANQNIVITYGSSVTLNASATTGTVSLYRNASLSNTATAPAGNATETVTLGAGVWEINASVVSNNANYSDNTTNITYYVTVNKASPTNFLNLQINVTGADSIRAYPNVTNVTGWSNVTGQTGLGFVLFRNGANMTINNTAADYNRTEINLLGVGNYTYIYNTTGNANYTSGSITMVLNITKGTPALGLFINSSASNKTYGYPTVARITGNNTDVGNSGMVYELFRNSTNITDTVASNDANLTLGAGVHQLIYNATSNANYTSANTTLYLTISKAATSMQVWLNGTAAASATYNRTQVMNFTAVLNVSGKTIYLESNYSAGWLNQSVTPLENLTTLNTKGTYNFTAYFNADENYTASANYTTVTVNDVSLPVSTANATSLASGSAYSTSANYGFQVNWADDVAVFNATFQLGRPGGTLTNYTNSSGSTPAVRLTGSTYHINFTQNQLGPAGTYNITWFANDTSNNWNSSDVVGYTVAKAATNTTLWINSVAANASVQKGNNINLTATVNITGTVYIYANLTGWVLLSNSTGTLTNTTSSSGVSPLNYSNITAYFAANENYTASSQHFHINVTADTTPPTIQLFNATSQPFLNASIVKKYGSTFAVNASVSDTGVGVTGQNCTAYVNGTAAGSGTESGGFCNMTVTMPAGGNGNVTLNITINDTNGNLGSNASFVVTMDNTAPNLTIDTPVSGQYLKGTIWVNGTVYDNIAMGTANISVNNSNFSVILFNGGNNTAFNVSNVSALADGYIALNLGYVDLGGNSGNATIAFYADNTPPSAAVGLTNSSSGTYAANASQIVQVAVTDNLQTNATITLNYTSFTAGSLIWTTTIMSGTPGTSTVYTATIDTRHLSQSSGYVIQYYIIGTDNATNSISSSVGGGSAIGSPLANITIGNTGTIQGYVIQNGNATVVSGATVSDGTRAAVSNSVGFYQIISVPVATYTLTVSAANYITNSSAGSVTVTAGVNSNVNVTIANNATGSIDGYVLRNGTTTAVSGATVSDGTRTVTTNTNGFYIISGVPAGNYTVTSSATDYVTNSTTGVSVSVGSTTRVNMTMANNATGSIQGYIKLTNTTIKPNNTVSISIGAVSVTPYYDSTTGYYSLSNVPAGTYTLSVGNMQNGYWTNSTSVSVTAGTTTNKNITVTGAENFNITIPGTVGSSISGFYNAGWQYFKLTTQILSGTTSNYTIANVFGSVNGNFTIIYRYTTAGWTSYISGTSQNDLTSVASSSDDYYIYMNATDRVELGPKYI